MAKRLRKVVSREKEHYWQEKILVWGKSGLSKAAFCRQHGLNSRQFLYWSLKHKKTPVSSLSSIVPVNINRAFTPLGAGPDSGLSLFIRDNYRIEVSKEFDSSTLKELIHTLMQL
jgi:hypothetical protein